MSKPTHAAMLAADDHVVCVVEHRSAGVRNHMAAVAINYFAYNFINNRTLRVSPAMAS